MAKLLITRAGESPMHRFIDNDRISLGRQASSGVVLDANGVSKEHAVLLTVGNDHILEDLGSTNGTLVNGQPVKRRILQNRDQIEIGPYRIQYVNQRALSTMDFDQTMMFEGESVGGGGGGETVETARQRRLAGPLGGLRGVQGSRAGENVILDRLIQTFSRPDGSSAAILRRPKGYVIMKVAGRESLRVNKRPVGEDWLELSADDQIDLGGDVYAFYLRQGVGEES
ncbi:MAG: FHA domain-containing protein [Pseudomonadota bacterium]